MVRWSSTDVLQLLGWQGYLQLQNLLKSEIHVISSFNLQAMIPDSDLYLKWLQIP